MCDKRFMPKTEVTSVKTLQWIAAFQLSSPFQLLKKTVRRPRRLCAKLEVLTSFHDT